VLLESDRILGEGDRVVVNIDGNTEVGVVANIEKETPEESRGKVLRLASDSDLEIVEKSEEQKPNLIDICKENAKRLGLEMKIIDARVSFDGKQIIFVFTADGRVDFRELVKDLSKELKKLIRMQQIGSRDETRALGGCGICGRTLCCASSRGSIQSITTDMARVQQIAHRGTERISGLCGRLMCCLAYEASQYKEMLKDMPEVYSTVNCREGKGTVIEINGITQEIKVKLENGKYVAIKKEDIK
jgi:cell fate regulator YaaT (PSP1 superfamily)